MSFDAIFGRGSNSPVLDTASEAISGDITINSISPLGTYYEVGVTFYSDSELTNKVSSGITGTYSVKATPAASEYQQDISGNTDIDLSIDLGRVTRFDTSVKSITISPNTIVGAAYWKITVVTRFN